VAFDPARTSANCPDCGVYTSAAKGQPTPIHQQSGSRQTCSGTGKPAV
jgi:hypothetical protein